MLYIVGMGPGSREYILPKAIKVLDNSDIIIGFSRLIKELDFLKKKKVKVDSLREIIEFINENGEDNTISIVASGDPTFFGISEYINNNFIGNVEVIPGLSSFQYLTSKINKSWNNAYTGSIHGRAINFIEKVLMYPLSIWLTDNKNNSAALCNLLYENKINCKVIIGENLSYENEKILEGLPEEFLNEEISSMSILVVERNIGDKDDFN